MANSEDARKNVTSELGRLLWVCRRNGTWWPGQILSLDQVPKSFMSSRRSGTPIKLLGKEDAFVEWINIEKSKRIKAFRCSEFNACIEEVKASADNFDKKPVKYARRGVAILQALQLEGEQNSEDKPQDEITELSSPLVPDEVDHEVEGSSKLRSNSNLGHGLSHYGALSEDTNFEQQITRKRKINSPNNSEGVEEVGVGLASKRGSQVEAQSLGPHHYIDSGLDTSGAATAVILGTSIETESRLNVHSIVGHPPNVEVLDDGFSDDLTSGVSKVPKSEVEDLKKTSVACIPLSQIFSLLKANYAYK